MNKELCIKVGKLNNSILWCTVEKTWKKARQCTYNITLKLVRTTGCCSERAINVTYSECVFVALIIQHAKRMRRIILSSVARLDLPYFSTLSHKRYDYRKESLNIKFAFWFSVQLLSEICLILRRNVRYTILYIQAKPTRCNVTQWYLLL